MKIPKNTKPLAATLLAGASAFTILVAGIAVDGHKVPGFGVDAAYAQQGGGGGGGSDGGGGGGGESGGGGSGGSNAGDDGGSQDAGSDMKQSRSGQSSSNQGGSGGSDSSGGGSDNGGGSSAGGEGGKPPTAASDKPADAGKPADTGKPDSAGNQPTDVGGGKPAEPGRPDTAGSGDDYGDLWVVLRDANGLPIYVTVIGEQDQPVLAPQPVDANGVPIPLDPEGAPLLVLRDVNDADGDGDTLELIVDPNFVSTYTYTDASGNQVTIDVTYIKADGTPVASAADAVADDSAENPYTAVQEVELGRTNVSRAPLSTPSPKADSTLENALAEALYSISQATSIEFDEAGRIVVVTADGEATAIDSPVENLALYKYILDGGTIDQLPADTNLLDLAASLLGAASDKEEALDIDEIAYLNTFLEIAGTLTDADGNTYYDFSTFTYDRTEFADVEVSWLEPAGTDADGNPLYVLRSDTILNAVFGGEELTATNIDGFTTAADDARAIIEFVHSNPVPVVE
ncbi:MAG: hypothetical protein WAU86_01080 [Oricola sp.]